MASTTRGSCRNLAREGGGVGGDRGTSEPCHTRPLGGCVGGGSRSVREEEEDNMLSQGRKRKQSSGDWQSVWAPFRAVAKRLESRWGRTHGWTLSPEQARGLGGCRGVGERGGAGRGGQGMKAQGAPDGAAAANPALPGPRIQPQHRGKLAVVWGTTAIRQRRAQSTRRAGDPEGAHPNAAFLWTKQGVAHGALCWVQGSPPAVTCQRECV